MKPTQCSSCGGFCKKSGCERENVKHIPQRKPLTDERLETMAEKLRHQLLFRYPAICPEMAILL